MHAYYYDASCLFSLLPSLPHKGTFLASSTCLAASSAAAYKIAKREREKERIADIERV